jgi:FkbM family methyltransferase
MFTLFNSIIGTVFYLLTPKGEAKNILKIDTNTKLKIRPYTTDLVIYWEVWKLKEYEDPKMVIQENANVVDIGAQAGIFTVWAARKAPQGKVFSIEPHPKNYKYLLANKTLNKLSHVKTYGLALGKQNGNITLYTSPANTGGHSIYNLENGRPITVPTFTFESFLKQANIKHIDYLKIDTEGAEYDILLNTPKNILKNIDKIFLEYHDNIPEKYTHHDLVKLFKDCGFTVKTGGMLYQRLFLKTGYIKAWRD